MHGLTAVILGLLGPCVARAQISPATHHGVSEVGAATFSDIVKHLELRAASPPAPLPLPPPPVTPEPRGPRPNFRILADGSNINPEFPMQMVLPDKPEGFQMFTRSTIDEAHDDMTAEIGHEGIDGVAANFNGEPTTRITNVISQAAVFIYVKGRRPFVLGARFALNNPRPIQLAIGMAKATTNRGNYVSQIYSYFPQYPDIANTYALPFTENLNRVLEPRETSFPCYFPDVPVMNVDGSIEVWDFSAAWDPPEVTLAYQTIQFEDVDISSWRPTTRQRTT